jgi:predicted small metal-binding protein
MKEELMKVTCDPQCGFMVQSHDKKELIGIVKNHVKNMHKKNITDEDVMKMAKKV